MAALDCFDKYKMEWNHHSPKYKNIICQEKKFKYAVSTWLKNTIKHIGHFIKGYARSTVQLKAKNLLQKIKALKVNCSRMCCYHCLKNLKFNFKHFLNIEGTKRALFGQQFI
jgi:hypothetical protein